MIVSTEKRKFETGQLAKGQNQKTSLIWKIDPTSWHGSAYNNITQRFCLTTSKSRHRIGRTSGCISYTGIKYLLRISGPVHYSSVFIEIQLKTWPERRAGEPAKHWPFRANATFRRINYYLRSAGWKIWTLFNAVCGCFINKRIFCAFFQMFMNKINS